MAALALKLFYLRTREKGMSQQAVAEVLGVRQATLSHLERGQSAPAASLLVELCRFFDVTPTWLLDDERDVPPLPTERWSLRNGLATVGMWVEAPARAVVKVSGGKALCPLLPGEAFFDGEACEVRRRNKSDAAVRAAMAKLIEERADLNQRLAAELEAELARHPLQRDAARPVTRRGGD